MDVTDAVFKAYDIRGIYGEQIDEELAERFKLLQGHGVAVDESTRPAVGIDDPSQQAGIVFVERIFLEPFDRSRDVVDRELRTELGALRPVAYELTAAAIAQHEAKGIDDAAWEKEWSAARLAALEAAGFDPVF